MFLALDNKHIDCYFDHHFTLLW